LCLGVNKKGGNREENRVKKGSSSWKSIARGSFVANIRRNREVV